MTEVELLVGRLGRIFLIAAAIEAVLVVVVCEELLESTETDEVP